jgi:DNA-binding NtrC family response regulator
VHWLAGAEKRVLSELQHVEKTSSPLQMAFNPRILLIEDDARLAANLRQVLEDEGFVVTQCSRGDDGLRRATTDCFEVVLTDLRLPGLGGLELVRQLRDARSRLPVLLMTAHGTIETAIEATKLGAYDYLQKPFEMEELLGLLNKAAESSRLMHEPVALADSSAAPTALIGVSRVMQHVCKEVGRVAAKPVSVLIRGETGTGKELIARALYQHSDRAKAPFIAINCAAIPETLLESELFGHERGAFTGAEQRRVGRFEQAHHGTLFLDEIGDLTPGTQAKLLRVLQEKCIQRLGSNGTIEVDVRILAATHRSLEAMIREGHFREDLFYRLSVATIELPPLRARREDVPALAQHFLRKNAAEFDFEPPRITADALALMQNDAWPGNVRELENVIRRLLLGSRGLPIDGDAVRDALAARTPSRPSPAPSLSSLAADLLQRAQEEQVGDAHAQILADAEREILIQAITLAQGNQSKAARWLGLSRLTLREKLTALGLRNVSSNHPQSSED